jgi:DNA-binding winged helix-turn-helix (wHTH) protein
MQGTSSNDCAFGDYSVSSDEQILRYKGTVVALAPKVVATLVPFFEEPGRVISKQELIERIWPDGSVEDSNALRTCPGVGTASSARFQA